MNSLVTLAQVGGAILILIYLAVIILILAGYWKMFEKAGKSGAWVLIILVPIAGPFIFLYHYLQIAGRPGWWLILMIIPIVNIVIAVIVAIDIAKVFGRGVGTALGLIFLPFIFIPILGFGSAQYVGPAAAASAPTAE